MEAASDEQKQRGERLDTHEEGGLPLLSRHPAIPLKLIRKPQVITEIEAGLHGTLLRSSDGGYPACEMNRGNSGEGRRMALNE